MISLPVFSSFYGNSNLYNPLIYDSYIINCAYKQYKKIMKLKVRTKNMDYDKISNREKQRAM